MFVLDSRPTFTNSPRYFPGGVCQLYLTADTFKCYLIKYLLLGFFYVNIRPVTITCL